MNFLEKNISYSRGVRINTGKTKVKNPKNIFPWCFVFTKSFDINIPFFPEMIPTAG